MIKRIAIFDTTLRDGEQSPGCSMQLGEKLQVARQLEKLGVDVVEAGFAIASPGDFEAVSQVAKALRHTRVASLARATKKDIDAAAEALSAARYGRIHTFIATSDIHMQYKLKRSPEQVLEQAMDMVRYAKALAPEVEFSAEDASRTRPEFLYRIIEGVIRAGATVINIPDTVGYTTPEAYYDLIDGIRRHVNLPEGITLSVHCHNDLGLAVANSLAAIRAGATQVEVTVNGIGERAGNAALEELVMALKTRQDDYQAETGIDTRQIYPTSRLVAQMTGMRLSRNKAIVGENAFAHESGIHQHGMLENPQTYEIMTPESIGLTRGAMVLGKHSGKHAIQERLEALGFTLSNEGVDQVMAAFKALADKKKHVDDRDLEALAEDHIDQNGAGLQREGRYRLVRYVINTGNEMRSMATVCIATADKSVEGVAIGEGPVDAAFKALEGLMTHRGVLEDYRIQAITEGEDAQGEVRVTLSFEDTAVTGRGLSMDILEASLLAYLDAQNRWQAMQARSQRIKEVKAWA